MGAAASVPRPSRLRVGRLPTLPGLPGGQHPIDLAKPRTHGFVRPRHHPVNRRSEAARLIQTLQPTIGDPGLPANLLRRASLRAELRSTDPATGRVGGDEVTNHYQAHRRNSNCSIAEAPIRGVEPATCSGRSPHKRTGGRVRRHPPVPAASSDSRAAICASRFSATC